MAQDGTDNSRGNNGNTLVPALLVALAAGVLTYFLGGGLLFAAVITVALAMTGARRQWIRGWAASHTPPHLQPAPTRVPTRMLRGVLICTVVALVVLYGWYWLLTAAHVDPTAVRVSIGLAAVVYGSVLIRLFFRALG